MRISKSGIHAAILLSVLISCSVGKTEPDKLAKNSIKQYLSKRLHDLASYESVEFIIARPKVRYINTAAGKMLEKKKDSTFLYISEILHPGVNHDSVSVAIREMESLLNRIVIDSSSNKWHVTHSFRSKNPLGATVLTTNYYLLDSIFTVIQDDEINPIIF